MTIIGLSGAAGSGKDVVASHLVAAWGFTRLGFADALRDEVCRIFNRTLTAYLEERAGKPLCLPTMAIHMLVALEKPPVIRRLLQEFGTELRRHEDKNHWVSRLAERAEALSKVVIPRFVIPDCRFENELVWVKTQGGESWRIERPGIETTAASGHASEEEWQAWPFELVLKNDGTIEDLALQVDDAVRPIICRWSD